MMILTKKQNNFEIITFTLGEWICFVIFNLISSTEKQSMCGQFVIISFFSLETQRNGLVFIYDMTQSKYSNFDYELSIKILSMLKVRFMIYFINP